MTIDVATIPAGTWTLDPTHSDITFSVRHLAISKVRGAFEKFDVTVVTTTNPADTTVTASVDVASVNTNQADRDGHLKTSDFFLVEEFPTMDFVSTGVRVDGDVFFVDGDLTLRGVTKPVTLKGELGGVMVDGYGQTKLGASASTKINRLDFGVNWNAALEAGGLTLGNDVTINFEIQVTLQP
ncbi:YceI family protein [Conyzicola sp.]|uniref:YceI family protein n=1 Tax=Conyzicola sp. TaxID=1969404 RepID=UPI0039899D5B